MRSIFVNFTLIDGTGSAPIEDAYMVVEDDRILETGCGKRFTDDVTDLGGRYVMPGLMDCHVHMTCPTFDIGKLLKMNAIELTVAALNNLRLWLNQGVTFIRDMGGCTAGGYQNEAIEFVLRDMIKRGDIQGPDVYASGELITMTGGHGNMYVSKTYDGPSETMKAARNRIKSGADVIKLIATGGVGTEGTDVRSYQYNENELRAAATEAHKAGRRCAAHCHSAEGIKNAIRAGIDSVEHGTLADDEAIELMYNNDTWLVPTLAIGRLIVEMENLNTLNVPRYMIDKERAIIAEHGIRLKKAYERGVKIACGTDLSPMVQPYATAKELAYLMEVTGMSSMEAIICATRNSAFLIGVEDDYGTLEADKYADFLVLDHNPLDDIAAVERMKSVYKRGKVVSKL